MRAEKYFRILIILYKEVVYNRMYLLKSVLQIYFDELPTATENKIAGTLNDFNATNLTANA